MVANPDLQQIQIRIQQKIEIQFKSRLWISNPNFETRFYPEIF
jgi:hypothetical protein